MTEPQANHTSETWPNQQKIAYQATVPSLFQTPLHLALRENNLDIIEILLAFGADPAVKDRRGNNAFHMAAATGDVDVMRAVARNARRRADINDFGNGGEALHT